MPPGFKNGKGNAYETPLRDKTHGRIYRLVAKNGKQSPILDLKNAKPARYPHADNTNASALELANLFDMFVDDFDLGAYSRWAMYNVWRAITPPPQDFPLAVCDAQSVSEASSTRANSVVSSRPE